VAVPVQHLRIGGRSSRAEYQFVVQGLDRPAALRMVAQDGRCMSADEHFADVNSDLQINATQAVLIVDKDRGKLARGFRRTTSFDLVFRLRQPAGLDHLRHRR